MLSGPDGHSPRHSVTWASWVMFNARSDNAAQVGGGRNQDHPGDAGGIMQCRKSGRYTDKELVFLIS